MAFWLVVWVMLRKERFGFLAILILVHEETTLTMIFFLTLGAVHYSASTFRMPKYLNALLTRAR